MVYYIAHTQKKTTEGFPGGTVVENPAAGAGDKGLSPGPGDPTCHGAAEPVCHNCLACTLEPTCHNCSSLCAWSLCSAKGKATTMRGPHTTTKSSPHSQKLGKANVQQRRPNAAKNKKEREKKKRKGSYFYLCPHLFNSACSG